VTKEDEEVLVGGCGVRSEVGTVGSRPRRERCEGVRGMSVIWSLREKTGRRGLREVKMLKAESIRGIEAITDARAAG
jgi:hypothetical protein